MSIFSLSFLLAALSMLSTVGDPSKEVVLARLDLSVQNLSEMFLRAERLLVAFLVNVYIGCFGFV